MAKQNLHPYFITRLNVSKDNNFLMLSHAFNLKSAVSAFILWGLLICFV